MTQQNDWLAIRAAPQETHWTASRGRSCHDGMSPGSGGVRSSACSRRSGGTCAPHSGAGGAAGEQTGFRLGQRFGHTPLSERIFFILKSSN